MDFWGNFQDWLLITSMCPHPVRQRWLRSERGCKSSKLRKHHFSRRGVVRGSTKICQLSAGCGQWRKQGDFRLNEAGNPLGQLFGARKLLFDLLSDVYVIGSSFL